MLRRPKHPKIEDVAPKEEEEEEEVLLLSCSLFPTVNDTNVTALSVCEVEATLTLLNMLHSDVLVAIDHPEMYSVSMNEEREVGKC
jgi:hypothetical protein